MKVLKNIIAGVLSLALFTVTQVYNVEAVSLTYNQGDINANGSVDLTDLSLLSIYLKGYKSSFNSYMSQRLDVNLDGIIDIRDKNEISNFLVGHAPVTLNYNITNAGVPSSNRVRYRKYNASTGEFEYSYYLSAANAITPVNTLAIIGDDDRRTDYSKPGIVKLYSTSDETFNATGFVVDEHTILTAAHCVFNTSTDQSYTNIRYSIYENGSWSAIKNVEHYHIPTSYFYSSVYSSIDDYAVLTVEEDLSDYVMDLGVARDCLLSNNPIVYVTGYSVWDNDRNPAENISIRENIVTASGNLMGISNEEINYDVDMVGGESGGPLYTQYRVWNSERGSYEDRQIIIGINVCSLPNTNFARRITTDVLKFIFDNDEL